MDTCFPIGLSHRKSLSILTFVGLAHALVMLALWSMRAEVPPPPVTLQVHLYQPTEALPEPPPPPPPVTPPAQPTPTKPVPMAPTAAPPKPAAPSPAASPTPPAAPAVASAPTPVAPTAPAPTITAPGPAATAPSGTLATTGGASSTTTQTGSGSGTSGTGKSYPSEPMIGEYANNADWGCNAKECKKLFIADCVQCQDAIYPEISKELKEEGHVLLKLNIAPDGKVVDIKFKLRSGHARLDNAIYRTVKNHWRFPPDPKENVRIATIRYDFSL